LDDSLLLLLGETGTGFSTIFGTFLTLIGFLIRSSFLFLFFLFYTLILIILRLASSDKDEEASFSAINLLRFLLPISSIIPGA